MRKKLFTGAVAAIVLLFVVGVVGYVRYATHQQPLPVPVAVGGQPMLSTTTITIGTLAVVAEVAAAPLEQIQGLSGRRSLADGTGMLFIFDPPTTDGFWMKDMRFSLDIVWADASGVIVTINQNISPDTYPAAFRASAPARYVLELPAGYTAAKGIAVGQKIVVQ